MTAGRAPQQRTTAVVTGAARGIGFALAQRLASAGHAVCLTDLDGDAAAAAADRVGGGAWGVAQDVRDVASHREVAAAATERGRLAVWVNNAGVLLPGAAWEHTDDEVATIVDVNVGGVVAGSRAAVDAMADGGGAILNIASLSAYSPVPGLALYAMTKAAVRSFTTSLQGDLDHAGLPVRARALCPDVVDTRMVTDRAGDRRAALLFAGPAPLTVDEVADAGIALLDGPQLVRILPRWRGLLVNAIDLAPSVGLRGAAVLRRLGERRQRRA